MPAILLFLIGLFPDLRLHWGTSIQDSLTVQVSTFDDEALRCLDSGREVRVRVLLRSCKRRTAWFDRCAEPLIHVRGLQYDPITESYTFQSDQLNDDVEPTSIGIPSRLDALKSVMTIERLPLRGLGLAKNDLAKNGKLYVAVRSFYECKGLVSKTWARLSTALTFGLIEVGQSDTGWINFDPRASVADLGATERTRKHQSTSLRRSN